MESTAPQYDVLLVLEGERYIALLAHHATPLSKIQRGRTVRTRHVIQTSRVIKEDIMDANAATLIHQS